MSFKTAVLALACLASSVALPIRREVPQEHSHEPFLTSVRKSLAANNPAGITDSVFGLLGNAAAIQGAGKITDATCLQQATADQAFSNAKAAGDVQGQVDALIYRALERNSGQVGLVTDACTSIQAVNPEIAAIQQHQDPASENAAAVNKAITLELAKQIQKVGGDPLEALKAGTFAPGDLNDSTAKGNTCDDANDANGCIFTQNLLVADATEEEILAAVGANNTNGSSQNQSSQTPSPSTSAVSTSPSVAASASGNLQTFTGSLGGAAPQVTSGGRGFEVQGSDDFLNLSAAIGRSCDIQHNQCANFANSADGKAAGVSVGQCDQQNNACRAAA